MLDALCLKQGDDAGYRKAGDIIIIRTLNSEWTQYETTVHQLVQIDDPAIEAELAQNPQWRQVSYPYADRDLIIVEPDDFDQERNQVQSRVTRISRVRVDFSKLPNPDVLTNRTVRTMPFAVPKAALVCEEYRGDGLRRKVNAAGQLVVNTAALLPPGSIVPHDS